MTRRGAEAQKRNDAGPKRRRGDLARSAIVNFARRKSRSTVVRTRAAAKAAPTTSE